MLRRPLLAALVAVVALALAVTACGDDGTSTTRAGGTTNAAGTTMPPATSTNPVATAPEATQPPPDLTEPGATTVPPPATEEAPPSPSNTEPAEPDEGGDEEPIRVPATFTIRGGALEPPTITVPPFLAVEISVTAADGGDHRVVVRTPQPRELTVEGGRRAVVRLPGLRAGRYAIELDGRPAGTLVAGGEVGP